MSDGDVPEDRGFKALFTAYPRETVAFFAPDLVAAHGQPVTVEPLQQELPLPDLGEPSRFLDLALLATWADGSRTVILLVEHWSQARRVDLDRAHWYYAGLRLRHPGARVLPLMLVTDPGGGAVPDRLEEAVGDLQVLVFKVRVVRIGPADLPRLRGMQNRVAALFLALAIDDAVEAVVAVLSAMTHAPGPLDDIRRFLPLARKLAKMNDADEARFRHRLREEPDMSNILDEVKSEGRAEGAIEVIRILVADGLPLADARRQLERLVAKGVITAEQSREALQRLG